MIKGSILNKDITTIEMYAPNIRDPKYINKILTELKGEICNNTIIGDFSTPLSIMDRSFINKINKEILD